MDFNKILKRVMDLITKPVETMQIIRDEAETIKGLFVNYALVLAAIPAVAGLLGLLIYGMPFGLSITVAISYYIAFLVSSALLGVLIDALAPQFGSQKDMVASFKVALYSFTAVWVSAVIMLLPDLKFVFYVASLYSVYLCYLGLIHIKRVAQDKLIPYLAISAVATAILVYLAHDVVLRMAFRSYFRIKIGSLM